MEKQIEIVVVGLSHYISTDREACDAWARAQKPGTIVSFEWEPENAFTPGLAFKAYIGLQQVGYASRDDCRKLLALKDKDGFVQTQLKEGERKALKVLATVPEGIDINDTPVVTEATLGIQPSLFPQGHNLVSTQAESQLKHILRQLSIAPSAELLQAYVTNAHRTLSHEVLSNLYPLYQQYKAQYPAEAEAAYDLHKDLGIGTALAYELWTNLMSDLRQQAEEKQTYDQWANYLFSEDAKAPHLQQLNEAKRQLETWLEQLPHAIWRTYHHNEPKWAQMLYYQQPSREVLYHICTHWMALEFVNSLISNSIEKPSAENMAKVHTVIETVTETETTPHDTEQSVLPWEPILTDPDELFDKRRTLRQIYEGLQKASLLVKENGDWGLVAIALGEDEGIEAFCAEKLPLKGFAALLVNWGLVKRENQTRIYNSIKRRSSDYQKLGNSDASSADTSRYEIWNERVQQFIGCFE